MSESPYNRILLKLSGESFAAPGQRGISMQEVVDISTQVQRAAATGVQIAIVEPTSVLRLQLEQSPAWQQLYRDDMAVVFRRKQ